MRGQSQEVETDKPNSHALTHKSPVFISI